MPPTHEAIRASRAPLTAEAGGATGQPTGATGQPIGYWVKLLDRLIETSFEQTPCRPAPDPPALAGPQRHPAEGK